MLASILRHQAIHWRKYTIVPDIGLDAREQHTTCAAKAGQYHCVRIQIAEQCLNRRGIENGMLGFQYHVVFIVGFKQIHDLFAAA